MKRVLFLIVAVLVATAAVFTAPDSPEKAAALPAPATTAQATAARPAGTATYAALGDSIAAGLGLAAVTPPSGNDTLCGRSTQSYPYLVATSLGKPLNHVACSGATVGDLVTKQAVDGPNITAQLTTAFASGKPELITITAGANDAHWDGFIRGCYATSCNNAAATGLANAYLTALSVKLYAAYTSIYLRSAGTPPPVIVTGYYNPLSDACTQLQTNITADEIAWLNAEVASLNQTIANISSQYSFVKFVPVDFTGHDICSADPWIQGPTAAAPFHPTAVGQAKIAEAVIAATR